MTDEEKAEKILKNKFIHEMKQNLSKSTKICFIKTMMDYRSDKMKTTENYGDKYLGLFECKFWADDNFREDKIEDTWKFIRGIS